MRLRVDFSDLKLHKFNHRFNCDSPLCPCGQSSESTVHLFLHCQLYTDLRRVLLDSISEIILNDVRVYPDQHMCHILLYGSESFNNVANRMILESTIRYIKDSNRFKVYMTFNFHTTISGIWLGLGIAQVLWLSIKSYCINTIHEFNYSD